MEAYYLEQIYNLLEQLIPLANLITGVIQVCIIGVVLVILYKLFNLFF